MCKLTKLLYVTLFFVGFAIRFGWETTWNDAVRFMKEDC
jgi:hypothetical protein